MFFFTFPRKPSKNIVKTAISSISVQGECWVWNQIEVYTYSWSQARLFKHPKVTEKPTAVCLNPAYCLKASGCGNSLCTHGRSPTHFLRTSELVKPFCFGSWMKDFAVRGGGGNWARTDALDIKDAEDAVNCIQMGSICSPQWPALISHWHHSDRCSIRTSIEWNYVVPSGPFPCKSLSNLNVIYIYPFIHYWNGPTSRETLWCLSLQTLLIWAKINTVGESELFCFLIKDLSTVSCKTATVKE